MSNLTKDQSQSLKFKRKCAGCYTTRALGYAWLVQKVDPKEMGDIGEVFWIWARRHSAETSDGFPTKREAQKALRTYLTGRTYCPKWGWVYREKVTK